MIKKYRLLSIVLAVLMCISLLPCIAGAEEPITKTVYKNVAQNKYVYTGGGGNAGTNAQKLTSGTYYDGVYPNGYTETDDTALLPSGNKGTVATAQSDDWFLIDLGRKYMIKEVKLYSRWNNTFSEGETVSGGPLIAMQYVEVQGSNTETFDTFDKLIDNDTDITWDMVPCTAKKIEDVKPYRYIRIQRTGNTYYGFSEIEVFADVTLTEVSRDKTATASISSYNTLPSVTTDGEVSDSWLVEGVTGGKYLSVDLGEELPVSWIEMVARVTETDNEATRYDWEIYGAKDAPTLETAQNGTMLIPKLLAGYNGNFSTLFPKWIEGYLSMPIYSGAQEDTYRYLNFYKTTGNTALSEVRVFVTNPEVIKSEVKDSAVYLEFSEEMVSTEDYISVYNVTDKEDVSSPLIETLEDGRIKVSTPGLFGKDIKVTVEETAVNTKGVSLAAPFVEMFKTPSALEVSGYNAENLKFLDEEGEETLLASAKTAEMELDLSNLSDKPISVMLILAAYDENGNLLACLEDSVDVGEMGAELPLSLSLDGLNGVNSVSAFLIDGYGALKAWSPSVTKN